jgi:hypothetical protein
MGYRIPIDLEVAWTRRRKDNGQWEASVRFRGEGVYEFLGKQVRPCVFRPGERLGEILRDMWRDDGLLEAEIFNVVEALEGLDDRFIGHDFVVRWTSEPDDLGMIF